MRSILILTVVALLVLSAAAAWAATSQEDGIAGWPLAGSGGVLGDPFSNWTQSAGSFSNVVMWDYDNGKWVYRDGTVPSPNISMSCDIELRVEESGDSTVYWHVYDTGLAVPAGYLNWALKQNHPCWVGLTKGTVWGPLDGPLHGGHASYLGFTHDDLGYGILPGDIVDGNKIPFKVYYKQGAGAEVLANYTEGVGGWGYWSPERVPACDQAGYWKIVLDLKYHQPDGNYVLDPVMQVVPEL